MKIGGPIEATPPVSVLDYGAGIPPMKIGGPIEAGVLTLNDTFTSRFRR